MNDEPPAAQQTGTKSLFAAWRREDTHVNSLTLSTELRDSIVEYLRRCLPHEGVGVLAMHRERPSLTAVRFYPGRNMDRSPRRYTMDPADVLTALAKMKREKTRFGVIVHSHPIRLLFLLGPTSSRRIIPVS